MKALTLHQPWASLIALGVKTVETRSWPAPESLIGERIGIHAGARQVHTGNFLLLARVARTEGAITQEQERQFRSLDLPFGAVVATARLTDCVPIVDYRTWTDMAAKRVEHIGATLWLRGAWGAGDRPVTEISDQLPFGDFTPGRWGWLLDEIEPVDPPVPARGRQRLWTLPDEIAEQVTT